MNVRQIRVQME